MVAELFFLNLDREFLERFELERFLNFDVDNYDPLNSAILNELTDLKKSGRFIVQGETSRPDNISHKVYGDVQYWWVIMFYNNITDVNDIVTGLELNYPSLTDLEQYYFKLKSRQPSA